jgi:hypothetical protein
LGEVFFDISKNLCAFYAGAFILQILPGTKPLENSISFDPWIIDE